MDSRRRLAAELRSRASVLSVWVLDDMYRNPFWESRFASRGRKHAEQDAEYHVTYLATAVEMDSPSVMAKYAEWLRGVLTTRGMCTRHLDENFERLSDAIAIDDTLSYDRLPVACLEAARQALLYDDPIARELQTREHEIADRVFDELTRKPTFQETPGVNSADDVRYLVSFIADAVVQGSPQHLGNHFQWLADHTERVNGDSEQAFLVLDQLDRGFAMLTDDARGQASELLNLGRSAIPERPV